MSKGKSSCAGRLGAALMALSAACAALPASADLLTFDGNICNGGQACGDAALIDTSYGDVEGVVDVQYRNLIGNPSSDGLRFWRDDYNDLVNVAWTDGGDSNSRAEIFIKPLNGQAVSLHSFDLGAWLDGQINSQFTILDGALNVLFESGPLTIGIQPENLHNQFNFTDLTSNDGIRIQWGPSAFNVGIDNIHFTVAPVPLPAPAWLLSGGLLTLAARRRRSV
jgi:hypothetical protein